MNTATNLPSARSQRFSGLCIHFAKVAKFNDSSSIPRSFSSSTPFATRNSVRPFGVPGSRRMNDSDTAGRP